MTVSGGTIPKASCINIDTPAVNWNLKHTSRLLYPFWLSWGMLLFCSTSHFLLLTPQRWKALTYLSIYDEWQPLCCSLHHVLWCYLGIGQYRVAKNCYWDRKKIPFCKLALDKVIFYIKFVFFRHGSQLFAPLWNQPPLVIWGTVNICCRLWVFGLKLIHKHIWKKKQGRIIMVFAIQLISNY